MNDLGGRAASLITAVAVALVIVAVAILPFLSPQWVAFEQDRSQAAAWTGFAPDELRSATNAILSDLVLGPPDFNVAVGGAPVLNDREREHMRDVRTVFTGLFTAAAVSLAILVVASRRRDRRRTWRAVRSGAMGLIVATVALGVIGLVAFDQLFELFHRVFFPAGSYLFDPATDRLVQLFPFQFWQETALVVGVVIVALAVVTAWFGGRRAAALAAGESGAGRNPEPAVAGSAGS